MSAHDDHTRTGTVFLAYGLILAGAAALRIWFATGDLWIDEVWSLDHLAIARVSGDRMDRIALFFHSNTHLLNTLYLALVESMYGPYASPIAYRLLSIVAGVGTVFLAARIGHRWSPTTGVISALLVGFSYPLVHYAGEARGYSPMLFAALGCAYYLETIFRDRRPTATMAFVACSVIGLLAHLIFVVVQAALGIWALVEMYRQRRSIISALAGLAPLFGVQLMMVVVYGSVAVNNMVRGGDCCPEPALDSVRIIAGLTFGLDAFTVTSYAPLAILTLGIVAALVWLHQSGQRSWVFLLAVVLVFPLATIAFETRPDVIHRYFLPSALFALMIVAWVLSELWRRGGGRHWTAAVLIVLFCGGSMSLWIKHGEGGRRGQYRAAITDIAAVTDGLQRITTFPTFSAGKVFRYHARAMGLSERLVVVAAGDEAPVAADWFINGYLYGKPPEPGIVRKVGDVDVSYTLSGTYPQWGLSGDTWAVYRLLHDLE